MRLRNDSNAAQRNLTLQISSSLTWRLIELNGKPLQYVAEPYTTDIDHTGAVTEAMVTLPSAFRPRERWNSKSAMRARLRRTPPG